jgi:hypothetical protein
LDVKSSQQYSLIYFNQVVFLTLCVIEYNKNFPSIDYVLQSLISFLFFCLILVVRFGGDNLNVSFLVLVLQIFFYFFVYIIPYLSHREFLPIQKFFTNLAFETLNK